METNELKHIWKTLADEKLIDKDLAEENIARIITMKSSDTIAKLNKKLNLDFTSNAATALLVIAITVFATLFLRKRDQSLPVQGYIFLILACSFYAFRSLNAYSKIRLIKLSFCTDTILESLRNVKIHFEKITKKENVVTYGALIILTIYANVLINENTDFSNFAIHSLQGYVLLFSIVYLITLPWVGKMVFNKRFAGIIQDINNSIRELEESN